MERDIKSDTEVALLLNVDGMSVGDVGNYIQKVGETLKERSGVRMLVVPVRDQKTEVVVLNQPIYVLDEEMYNDIKERQEQLQKIISDLNG